MKKVVGLTVSTITNQVNDNFLTIESENEYKFKQVKDLFNDDD